MIQVDDVAKETLDILEYFDSNFVSKIPNKFLENLKRIAETSRIVVNIDNQKNLEEQEISEHCKDFISLIYYNYVADEEDKKEILNCWVENKKKNQNELNEKYNVNDIFNNINNMSKNNKKPDFSENAKQSDPSIENSQSNLPQIIEKHSFIKRIWKKLKRLFNKNN